MVKQQVESREDSIVPQAPPENTADTTVAALDPTLSDEDGAVLDAMRVPQQLQPRELTAQEIEAKYATTGIWAIAPKTPKAPSMVTLDDLFMISVYTNGKVSVKQAPPSLLFLAVNVPPCASAICRAIERPRPECSPKTSPDGRSE